MPNFEVVVRATITKTMIIEAETEEDAKEEAHADFCVLNDGTDENYSQETVSCSIVKE